MHILSADYDQIELRVIAGLAGEKVMIDAAKRGESLHITAALRLWGADYTPDQYRYTKNVNFGWAFGGGAQTLSEQTGLPITECAAIIRDYETQFPALRTFKRKVIDDVQNQALSPQEKKIYRALRSEMYNLRADTRDGISARKMLQARIDSMMRGKVGYVTNPFGRRMIVDAQTAYAGVNYLVQSSAADIMKHAFLRVMNNVLLEPTILLIIHDEILAQAPIRQAEAIAASLGAVMTTEFMGVPITASGKVYGRSWGDGYTTN